MNQVHKQYLDAMGVDVWLSNDVVADTGHEVEEAVKPLLLDDLAQCEKCSLSSWCK